ncbi:MAG: SDR family oxidoreductase [Mangrovicoccus sp.]|nr:SDR family oxidoreductase [Mangrovicoccus sp.]
MAVSGKRILVLGGARGIGRALCEQLLAQGAMVHVLDSDGAALDWARAAGPKAQAQELDMTDRPAVAALCAAFKAENTRFDGVVVAAAIHGGCPAVAMEDDFIARLLDINLGAHMGFVRDILPLLVDGGRLVGISSNCAEIGIPMESAYAATKAGLERYYEALVIELADRGIRPMVVQVGNVNTGFNETGNVYEGQGSGYTDSAYAKVIAQIDSANGMPPAQVAAAIAKLFSAKNPPFRSLVGINAKKTFWARRLAGTEISLKLLSGVFGLKG